jgi:hypothetical protein
MAKFEREGDKALERQERAKTFAAKERQRIIAERKADPYGTWSPMQMKTESIDDWDIRENYENAYPGSDFFRELGGRSRDSKPDFGEDYGPWIFGLPVVASVLLGIVAWSMYPLDARYHQWRTVQGTVTQVGGERLQGTNSGNLYISWVFDINGKKYTCEETRCGSIDVGATAKLRCKPSYQHVGSEVNECKFVSVRKA